MIVENDAKVAIIGAGISGIISAREMREVGFRDITILEGEASLGGVWKRYCWDNLTLTSSRWVTEFGCFPMKEELPMFLTPEHMIEYLENFCEHFDLNQHFQFQTRASEIKIGDNGLYSVETDKGTLTGFKYVFICCGLHGKPSSCTIPGIDKFEGEVFQGHNYKNSQPFEGKRVLCVGMGESGVGITSEISHVATKTVASASSFYLAPRVFPFNNQPFDQLQFRTIGRYMLDYQELLTSGTSWITKLPSRIRSWYINHHSALRSIPEAWLPKAVIPNFWAAKYWPKPQSDDSSLSGNCTRPEAPSDDIIYLINTGKIIPKGRVESLDGSSAHFSDGTREEVDCVVLNSGFIPGSRLIKYPNDWQYRHQDLYKGIFHPELPGLAFVGFVRPTIGSIPAMAEMQARVASCVFSNRKQLPNKQTLKCITDQEAESHAKSSPELTSRWPHIYFFEDWMDDMADLIDCKPKFTNFLTSWKGILAFFFGSTMPLRYRIEGFGSNVVGKKLYVDRVSKYLSTPPLPYIVAYLCLGVFYPFLLATFFALVAHGALGFPWYGAIIVAVLFLIAYKKYDVFRFIFFIPYSLPLLGKFYVRNK